MARSYEPAVIVRLPCCTVGTIWYIPGGKSKTRFQIPTRTQPKRPGDNTSADTPSKSKRLKTPGTRLEGNGDSDEAAGNVAEPGGSNNPESRREASGPAAPALAHAAASWPPSAVSSRRDISPEDFSKNAAAPEAKTAQIARRSVRIRMNVMDLHDIDIPRHRFEIKFFLEASWEVPDGEVILNYADEDSTGRPLMRGSDDIVRAGSDDIVPRVVPMLRRRNSSNAMSTGSDLPRALSRFSSCVFEGDNDTLSAPFDGSQFPFTSHTALSADGEKPAKLRWTPRLSFANQLELDKEEEIFETYKYKRSSSTALPRPVVVYRLRGTGVFQEHFELHAFPFDAQDLQICITSKHQPHALRLHKNPDIVEYKPVIPSGHFLLQDEYVTLV